MALSRGRPQDLDLVLVLPLVFDGSFHRERGFFFFLWVGLFCFSFPELNLQRC